MAEEKSKKQINAERLQALKDAKAKKAAQPAATGATATAAGGPAAIPGVEGATNGKPAKAPREPKTKTVRACRCGCGGQTTAYFVPGHDARFKGWLKKIEMGKKEISELPPAVQKEYTWTERGIGFVPDKDYKGDPYIPQCALEDVTETEEAAAE